MTEEQQHQPTSKQREYLADLLDRARKHGMPRISTESLTRDETSDWIAFLLRVLPREQRTDERKDGASKEEGSSSSSSSLPFEITHRHVIERVKHHDERSQYLLTPPLSQAPDGYRPAWDLAPVAWDHDHLVASYATEDLHEIVYCTLCSQEW